MFVYKLTKTKYANDVSGEGARLNGGRWNNKLVACIYTSESRALALVEYTVNVNIDEVPRALSFVVFEIPDKNILKLHEQDLPGNWKETPVPYSTKDFGSALLLSPTNVVIRVPSIIIPGEFNYLLNPLHANSKRFRIKAIEDFVFDVRLKTI